MFIYTVYNDLSKYSICIPVKHRKTAVCSRHRHCHMSGFCDHQEIEETLRKPDKALKFIYFIQYFQF